MINKILDIFTLIRRKIFRKYYVVDPIEDFVYTFGTRKECKEIIEWLQDSVSSNEIYSIYTRKQLTENMISTIHPKQSLIFDIILSKKT